ncbi:MAG: phosphoribosylglycinamide formyltransferase [Ferruginibacter sp.]|nr:phosphoribosylglycinamide formyltransferase [Ferruginibacter sp.]
MNIAIFASGAGTNAQIIIKTLSGFLQDIHAAVALIVTNNAMAGVINIAKNEHTPLEILDLKNTPAQNHSSVYLNVLKKHRIDFIVLAGYLKKIPAEVIAAYPQKIVNIHPALLPAYGGAGKYGRHVHEAVIAAGEKQSGITIHLVDDVYDHGKILFQASCTLEMGETVESLAKKIHALEHKHYTKEISTLILSQFPVK